MFGSLFSNAPKSRKSKRKIHAVFEILKKATNQLQNIRSGNGTITRVGQPVGFAVKIPMGISDYSTRPLHAGYPLDDERNLR